MTNSIQGSTGRFVPGRLRSLGDRLWSKVNRGAVTDCWPWSGSIGKDGYGRISVDLKPQLAHRVAYELSTGISPGELFVCHRCDNPPCCNPDHLFLGTSQDNVSDMVRKGRGFDGSGIGEDCPRAILNEDDVRSIRKARSQGVPTGQLAARYGVCASAIRAVVRRKTWSHVP